jgi:hypothetical protein
VSDSDIKQVLTELEQLMGTLRANVDALEAILTDDIPEVPGGQPATA